MAGGPRSKKPTGRGKGGGSGRGGAAAATSGDEEDDEPGGSGATGGAGEDAAADFDLGAFKTRMSRALDQLSRDLGGVRTSAHPRLLDSVHVDSPRFGTRVPLRSLATVVVRSAQLMVVEVYDKEDAEHVAMAIQKSPLALSARVEKGEVLVPVPRLTLETVERMTKLARDEGEGAKVEVRRVRHAAMEAVKRTFRKAPRDETRRHEKEVQDLTDQFVHQADEMVRAKIEDLRKNH